MQNSIQAFFALVIVSLSFSFVGCNNDDAGTSGCTKDTDCRHDRICENGVCVSYAGDSDASASDGSSESDNSGQPGADEDPTDNSDQPGGDEDPTDNSGQPGGDEDPTDNSDQPGGDEDPEAEWDWSEQGIPIFTPSPQPVGVCARRVLRYFDDQCNNTTRSQCEVKEYDAAGNVIYTHDDPDCDGNPINCNYEVFNEQGNYIYAARDADCDGKTNYCSVSVYDENGRRVELRNCDTEPWNVGEVHDTNCRYWIYDDHGNTILYQLDRNCDQQFISTTCYTNNYDENGNRIFSGTRNDCGDVLTGCKYYTYDSSGNLLTEAVDLLCNGELSDCTANTYDERGNLLSTSTGCRTPSQCFTYEYNEFGNKVREIYDSDCDGIQFSRCESFDYDANGRMVHHEEDENCNGENIVCHDISYSYTAFPQFVAKNSWQNCFAKSNQDFRSDENREISFIDTYCDGEIDSCKYTEIQENNLVDQQTCIPMRNGYCIYHSYSDDGKILTVGIGSNCVGQSNNCVCDEVSNMQCGTYSVADDGTVQLISCDTDCDGTSDFCYREETLPCE